MVLVFHIIIALMSLVYATYVYFKPSNTKLRVSYIAIALTLISGTFLVFKNPSHMMETCLMGLFYTGVMTVGVVAAKRKLLAKSLA
jgi:hypothetical protein